MTDLIDKVTNKYSFEEYNFEAGTIDDMTMLIETSELKVLLVFSNIEIYSYSEEEDLNYSFILESLYLLEKITKPLKLQMLKEKGSTCESIPNKNKLDGASSPIWRRCFVPAGITFSTWHITK